MADIIKDVLEYAHDVIVEGLERAPSYSTRKRVTKHAAVKCKAALAAHEANQKRMAELEEALGHIQQWADAYPIDVFPEPDFVKARKALEGAGLSLTAVSASNMRHVVQGVGSIARAALNKEGE